MVIVDSTWLLGGCCYFLATPGRLQLSRPVHDALPPARGALWKETPVCRVRRDQKGAGSYRVRHGMRLVPTELWLRQWRILPSGTWNRADS